MSSFSRSPSRRNSAAAPAFCFSIQAAAEPGAMPRVLELFAKRGLVPTKWHSAAAGGELQIDVQMAGLAAELGDAIARGLRQVVGVSCVLTSVKVVGHGGVEPADPIGRIAS